MLITLEKKELEHMEMFMKPHKEHIRELQAFLKNQRTIEQLQAGIRRHRSFLMNTWELSMPIVKELPCFSCQQPCQPFLDWKQRNVTPIEKEEQKP